jgi:hypothetical protein
MPSFLSRPRSLVIAVLALLPPVYFYPAVFGQVLLAPGDGWTQIFGLRVLIGRMLADGTLPLWNPYIFAGMPLLASIQVGALFPLTWLFVFLPPGVAMNAMVILTYHIALVGSYLYARRIGASRLGALVTGIAFTFGGYMLAHLGHTNRVAAAAWLPWVLLAVEQLHRRATWGWACLGAIFVALQLFAGDPQMTAYTLLVCGAYALFSLILREPGGGRGRFVAGAALMAVLGVLLSAIQLLPERELLLQGERARISYEYFSAYSLPPRQLFGLIFPYFFGGALSPPYSVAYWGEWSGVETCAYVGLLGLLLALVAVCAPQRQRLVWFWCGTAVVSLVLCFGAHLPFDLNRLLYRVPVYNLFRAPARNRMEFTFAVAVLAGMGMTGLAAMTRDAVRRALTIGTALLALALAATAVAYRFFGQSFISGAPRAAHAGSLSNWEAIFPLVFFVLSVAACWLYASRRSRVTGIIVVAVLLGDLAAFGQFFQWRFLPYSATAQMSDPPTVGYIKSREADLNSFRIYTLALSTYNQNYWMLNYPNLSVVRGLQSVNGYDPLRPLRMGDLAGDMRLDGVAQDARVFGPSHRGLDLLNVKYLLRERPAELKEADTLVVYDGVPFHNDPLAVTLTPGAGLTATPGGVMASELAVVTTLANALHLTDGLPVAKVVLQTKDGRVIERELLAGRDSAEWAIDRPDARALAKHRRARVVESWPSSSPAGTFEGHRYLARLYFDRAEVTRVELNYLPADGSLVIHRAALHDVMTGGSTPLEPVSLPPERWRKLANFGPVDVYENRQCLPRAWFVRGVTVRPRAEVLTAVKTGKFADGTPFDPADTALLETEDFGGRAVVPPAVENAAPPEVRMTHYDAHRIQLETRNPSPGLLVLSEMYSRDWEARVDGRKTPVLRADYALRAVAVPPGDHHVELFFRGPAFRNGMLYSGLGVLLMLAGSAFSLVLRRRGTRALRLKAAMDKA